MSDGLFDLDPGQVREDETAGMSAQQKLTFRQSAAIARGQHPLSLRFGHMPLHDEAAQAHPDAEGRKCGNCSWRYRNAWGYSKCGFGDDVRVSRGAATDCRAWWPGCRDHQYESETR